MSGNYEYMVNPMDKKTITKAVHDYLINYRGIVDVASANPFVSIKELFCKDAKEIKGVKVELSNGSIKLSVYIIIEYSVNIAMIANKLKEDLKSYTENLTNMNVEAVNICIKGCELPRN